MSKWNVSEYFDAFVFRFRAILLTCPNDSMTGTHRKDPNVYLIVLSAPMLGIIAPVERGRRARTGHSLLATVASANNACQVMSVAL